MLFYFEEMKQSCTYAKCYDFSNIADDDVFRLSSFCLIYTLASRHAPRSFLSPTLPLFRLRASPLLKQNPFSCIHLIMRAVLH